VFRTSTVLEDAGTGVVRTALDQPTALLKRDQRSPTLVHGDVFLKLLHLSTRLEMELKFLGVCPPVGDDTGESVRFSRSKGTIRERTRPGNEPNFIGFVGQDSCLGYFRTIR
jgi:hypothetical protein